MYERSYGSQWADTQGKDVVELAKLMRADFKVAKTDGWPMPNTESVGVVLARNPVDADTVLVKVPDWLKVSFRSERFSMGCSIDVRVAFDDRLWETCDGFEPGSKHEYEPGLFSGASCRQCATWEEDGRHPRLNDLAREVDKVLETIHWRYNHNGSESQVDYFDVRYYGHVDFDRPPYPNHPLWVVQTAWRDEVRARRKVTV